MIASILVVAAEGARRLRAQVESIVAAEISEPVEFVFVDDAADREVRAVLSELAGDVVIVRSEARGGRVAALRRAAEAASADVCIALGPHARLVPGPILPLVTAVRSGAALAAPVIGTPAGPVHGYRIGPDGSLLPNGAAGAAVEALALDCLAGRRERFLDLPAFDARDGHYEVALAEAMRGHGPLVVVPDVCVERLASGRPVSIVICSRDRADEMEGAVRGCLAHGAPVGEVEIVVVDNGSSDGTPERAAALAADHPGVVSLVHEPSVGLSIARQAGAAAARHGVVVYLDDDARPAPGWIEAIRDAFDDPIVAIAGGPIVGLWSGTAPSEEVLPRELEGFVGVLDRGDLQRETDPGDCPWGGNYAIRADVLEAVGGFDPRLGLSADARVGGEEVNVGRRVASAGLGRSVYVAEAAVGHRIGSWRIAPAALLVRAFQSGVELVRHERLMGTMPERALGQTMAVARRDLAATGLFDGSPLDAREALARIAALAAPLLTRFRLAYALGSTAAGAFDRGLGRVPLAATDDLVVTRAQGAGVIEAPVGPQAVAA